MTTTAGPEKKTILVVEDEDSLRLAMTYVLRANGYRILEAANGTIADAIALKESPDIIVSDVMMPNLDGIELLRQVRERHPSSPLFFLVSGFTELQPYQAYDLGVDGMFAKPFDRVLLLTAIKDRLRPLAERLAISDGESVVPSLRAEGVSLGRMGFFAPISAPLPPEQSTVDFSVGVSGPENLRLEGRGVVRWVRASATPSLKAGCGIEIEKLTSDSLANFLKFIDSHPTKSLIPQGS